MATVKVKLAGDTVKPSLTGRAQTMTKRLLQLASSRADRSKEATRPRLANSPEILIPAAIQTGSKILDLIVRRHPPYGIPVQRITEISSEEESEGKTTLVMHLIANAQRAGMLTQFQDTEHTYDPALGQVYGIDNSNLIYDNPDSVELIFDELDNRVGDIHKILKVGEEPPPLLYAWDTLSATPTFVELRNKAGQLGYGTQVARMMSHCLKRSCGQIKRHAVAFVIVNQGRVNPTILRGNPHCTAGGKALRFYASVRLVVRKLGPVCDHRGRQIGIKMRVTVQKNKVSPPDGVAEFKVLFDSGIQDRESWFWFFHRVGRLGGGQSGRWQLQLPDGGKLLKFTEASFQKVMEDAGAAEAAERYMEALAAQNEVPMKFHGKIKSLRPQKGDTEGEEDSEAEVGSGPEEDVGDTPTSIFDEDQDQEFGDLES